MILLFPLVLVGIALLCRSRGAGREGWRWFWAWACFGGLFALALLTGLSIGLLLLPAVALVGAAVARRAPGWREALGAVAGAAVVVEVLAASNGWTAVLPVSAVAAFAALAGYATSRARDATRAGLRT